MIKRTLILLIATAVAALAWSSAADTAVVALPIAQRIAMHDDMLRDISGAVYSNPSLRQWQQDYSYSDLSAGYLYDCGDKAVDVQRGKGVNLYGLNADSHIKHGSSTLWGSAAYTNGQQRDIRWNESADPDIVYPYFVADSVGGDMHVERYAFAGGYADHTDRWAWGVTLSYNAGLYYRNVDPRPRNTTGRLDIAVGGAMRVATSDYRVGLSAKFSKYKQSGDIEFVNELSDNSIWHLTGLGTHYERFAGNGYSHYYNGQCWGASIGLLSESRRGAVATVTAEYFTFDHILTSLNKLPLQSVADYRVSAVAGWLQPGISHDIAATAEIAYDRRTGTENIFGDPAGNIYPQIGALDLYRHTLTEARLNMLWQWRPASGTLLSVNPSVEWYRSEHRYLDPGRTMLLSGITPALTIKASRSFGAMWHMAMTAHVAHTLPVDNDSYLPFNGSIPAGMQAVDIDLYDILSQRSTDAGIGINATRALSHRYAIGIAASYSHHCYSTGRDTDRVDVALSFIF